MLRISVLYNHKSKGYIMNTMINEENGIWSDFALEGLKINKRNEISKKMNKQFKVTWLSGYGDNDGQTAIHSLKELETWNLDAYMGDEWEKEFAMLNIGEELLVGGPCGVEEVKYERIS